jgi:hypothetical protein
MLVEPLHHLLTGHGFLTDLEDEADGFLATEQFRLKFGRLGSQPNFE